MQIETGNVTNPNSQNISFEDFDIEDIPFRPLTDGLGFNNKSNDFKKPKINKSRVHDKLYQEMLQPNVASKPIMADVPVELEAFYGQKSPTLNKKIDFTKKVEKVASFGHRFTAWIIDLSIIGLVFTSVVFMMFVSTSFSPNAFLDFLKQDGNFIFPVVIFCLIYVIYNVVLGFSQTVGQKTLKIKPLIKMISIDPISFLIKRTLLELLSILTLGLPYLLKLDLNLLGNKIIRE